MGKLAGGTLVGKDLDFMDHKLPGALLGDLLGLYIDSSKDDFISLIHFLIRKILLEGIPLISFLRLFKC